MTQQQKTCTFVIYVHRVGQQSSDDMCNRTLKDGKKTAQTLATLAIPQDCSGGTQYLVLQKPGEALDLIILS